MDIRTGVRSLLLMTVAGLLIFTIPASAQDAREEVRAKLYIAGNMFINRGYVLTHEIVWGRLSEGEAETIGIELDGRMEYVIFGVCDNDCYNVNIDFYDMQGNRLAYNYEYSEVPYIVVPRGYYDRYLIQITMARCITYTCNYGVAVFGR
jgi:hypothetical protein